MQDRGENFSGLQTLQRLRTVRNFSGDDQRSQCPFCKIIVTRDVRRTCPLEQTVFLFSENILEILNRWMLSGTIANLHDLRSYLLFNFFFSSVCSACRFINACSNSCFLAKSDSSFLFLNCSFINSERSLKFSVSILLWVSLCVFNVLCKRQSSSRNRMVSACSSISRFSNLSRSASNSRIFRLYRSAKCNCVLRFYIGTIA